MVANGFKQFFGQDDLGSILDRKADLELIRRLQEQKANKEDLGTFQNMVDDTNTKLKHITVFMSEIAKILLPQKQAGKFLSGEDLNGAILKREQLIK